MDQITVIFDGYCVLCSGFARWLKKQCGGAVRLISAQSERGADILKQAGTSLDYFDEVFVKTKADDVLTGAPAILFMLAHAGRTGRFLYHIFRIFPSFVVRWGYRVIAENRYRWFGKRPTCSVIQD